MVSKKLNLIEEEVLRLSGLSEEKFSKDTPLATFTTPEWAVNKPFDDHFKCLICLNVVSANMSECSDCNKVFCSSCIQEWGRKSSTCPNCREQFNPNPKPNRFVVNVLNDLLFKCKMCTQNFKYS